MILEQGGDWGKLHLAQALFRPGGPGALMGTAEQPGQV